MQYTVDQLVRLARRENNSIRPYLFVNPLQGKHIPTNPRDAADMCQAIAEKINAAYPDDLLYVIGFAETATGIAACTASFLKNAVYYQNTTREYAGEACISFSEVHSHATDQLLRSAGLFDVFRPQPQRAGEAVPAGALAQGEKSLAIRLTLGSDAAALTDAEIEAAVQSVLQALGTHTGARLR